MDFEIIPAIDLKEGKCVRLERGNMARATEYGEDPLAMALHWQQCGATRLHLVDLDGAFAGDSVHLATAGEIFQNLRIPVQFGGGIRTLQGIERLLDAGVERVILGTVAVENPDLVEEAARRYGEQIVAGIDARDGYVSVRGWTQRSTLDAVTLGRRLGAAGIRRVIFTDVSRDGMLSGVNVGATAELAHETGLNVIASGGVTSIDDLHALWDLRRSGIEGVILGRALYEKRIDLPDALQRVKTWTDSDLQGDAEGEDDRA